MSWWQLIVFASASFSMSIFSGISGGGAGFITTPLAILFGLTPAQAVSSGKFNGLATTIGSLSSLRVRKGSVRKRSIAAIMALAFVVGLLVPYLIRSFDSKFYRITLGVILLAMIPLLMWKKIGRETRRPSSVQKGVGGVLLTASLFLQGAFSGGLGSLVNIVLMGLLGQTANEAHITKRWSQLILNVTIIFGVLHDHFIVWPVALTGAGTNLIGSHLGGHIATRKGDAFAVKTLLILIAAAATFLILGAL